jgi:3-hydroxybutyryl-CoA dehydrogenase
MTIVAIGGTATEKDLAAAFPAADINRVLVRTVAAAEDHPHADLYIDLDFVNTPGRKQALSRLLPAPVLINAVVSTYIELGYPFIRINGWPGFLERPVHELVVPEATNKATINELYKRLGRECCIVPDTPGMISARILATIINEAWFTKEEEVSSMEDIDTAMRLGTNYPMGPFEWGERIGLENIAGLLTILSRGNERYTPSESLLEAAKSLKYD